MEPSIPTWWEQPEGLFHPTAPVSPDVCFQTALDLPDAISISSHQDEVQLIFPLGPAVDSVEVQVHLGRMLLSGLHAGVRFSRAITLPNNLDLAHRKVQFSLHQIVVLVPRYPEAVWRRAWRRFAHWLLSAVQRVLARLRVL